MCPLLVSVTGWLAQVISTASLAVRIMSSNSNRLLLPLSILTVLILLVLLALLYSLLLLALARRDGLPLHGRALREVDGALEHAVLA